MSYGRLIEYVNNDSVKQVTISEDGRKAYIDLIIDGSRQMFAQTDIVNDPTFLEQL